MEDARALIKKDEILERLRAHNNGTLKLKPTQIKAAKILLRKVMTPAQIKAALAENE